MVLLKKKKKQKVGFFLLLLFQLFCYNQYSKQETEIMVCQYFKILTELWNEWMSEGLRDNVIHDYVINKHEVL